MDCSVKNVHSPILNNFTPRAQTRQFSGHLWRHPNFCTPHKSVTPDVPTVPTAPYLPDHGVQFNKVMFYKW